MDEQSITAGLLERLMSAISEEYWCAGWMHNLEYTLWDVITGRRAGICSPEEIEQLQYLSRNAVDGSFGTSRRMVKDSYQCRTGSGCTKRSA